MKYRGFREEALLAVAKSLENLGMKTSEVYAVMNLAGAKWRSVQIREGRSEETHGKETGQVFHEATKYVMNATMSLTAQLAKLGHATEGERFMFAGVGLTLNKLFTRGPRAIRTWVGEGDEESRRILLAFAVGSCIIVDHRVMDYFFDRIVRFRYEATFDSGKDLSDTVLAAIEKLGKAGNSILNPISDATK